MFRFRLLSRSGTQHYRCIPCQTVGTSGSIEVLLTRGTLAASGMTAHQQRLLCNLSVWLDEGKGPAVEAALAAHAEQTHALLSCGDFSTRRHADTVVARLLKVSPGFGDAIVPFIEYHLALERVRALPQSATSAAEAGPAAHLPRRRRTSMQGVHLSCGVEP